MRLSALLLKLENATVNAASRTVAATKALKADLQIERDAKAIARATELLGAGVSELAANRAQQIIAEREAKLAEDRDAKIAKLKAQLDELTKS